MKSGVTRARHHSRRPWFAEAGSSADARHAFRGPRTRRHPAGPLPPSPGPLGKGPFSTTARSGALACLARPDVHRGQITGIADGIPPLARDRR